VTFFNTDGLAFVGRPLTTARMTLRPYEAADLPGLHDLFGRDDVCRYLAWEAMDVDQARAKLEQRLGQTRINADGDPLLLAAIDAGTGRMIGEFMLHLKSARSGQGEIGWTIHPDLQGRGLATEGAWEMLRLGFDEVGLHRIEAGCDPRNVGSLRVMEHLGMRREAEFVENELVKGEWVGEIICAILGSEWRDRR
jgi:RimJ/RimL family protein N-acetyltransferase